MSAGRSAAAAVTHLCGEFNVVLIRPFILTVSVIDGVECRGKQILDECEEKHFSLNLLLIFTCYNRVKPLF